MAVKRAFFQKRGGACPKFRANFQAVFDVDPKEGLTIVELNEECTLDEVIRATGCTFHVFV